MKLLAVALLLAPFVAAGAGGDVKNPAVVIKTSLGEITVELEPEKAPATVKGFLQYVDDKFYDGTIFHRVISTFMIQGGGFDAGLVKKATRPPVVNEAKNGLTNARGTIAMARTSVPDSATSQFFINVKDNANLDRRDDSPQGAGYCVFGRVTSGMEVVDKIKAVPTGAKGGMNDVPTTPVVIESIRRK
ncbi:MAG TPA: peptidylprolyl isomerase [Thermoanaerobaculia bacterium]|nr:peptidylprolyl isomerase [Thermoanaerobaculia bacterium]